MRNAYRAQVPVEIGGRHLTLQFDYEALAAIRTQIGNDARVLELLRGSDPRAFSTLVTIGLARNHPDWTEDRVFKASPAIRPTVQAVEEALNALYFGPEGPPSEATGNPLTRIVRRAMRSLWPFGRRSAQA